MSGANGRRNSSMACWWVRAGGAGLPVAWGLVRVGIAVQITQESESGYTTIPARAHELDLRDPANGRILSRAGEDGTPFKTLKAARSFAAGTGSADDKTEPPTIGTESRGSRR